MIDGKFVALLSEMKIPPSFATREDDATIQLSLLVNPKRAQEGLGVLGVVGSYSRKVQPIADKHLSHHHLWQIPRLVLQMKFDSRVPVQPEASAADNVEVTLETVCNIL